MQPQVDFRPRDIVSLIQKEMSEVAIMVARIDERTKNLPELEQKVHDLHTYVTHSRGKAEAWGTAKKWLAGIAASLIVSAIVGVTAFVVRSL